MVSHPHCPECADGTELEFEPPVSLRCPDCGYYWSI